jgi:hypothetical protein
MKICSRESIGGARTLMFVNTGTFEPTMIRHSQRIVWKICREGNDTMFPQLYTPDVRAEKLMRLFIARKCIGNKRAGYPWPTDDCKTKSALQMHAGTLR